MQAIAALVLDDPYLKLAACDRIAARRERRQRIAERAVIVEPAPEPEIPPPPRIGVHIINSDGSTAFLSDDKIRETNAQMLAACPVSIAAIQIATAEFYHLERRHITGRLKRAVFVRARFASIYLAKQLTSKTVKDIGRRTGGRDHSTALWALRKVDELLANDNSFAAEIDAIKARITRAA